MKAKKGFTLIEIIICIALIAMIGTVSYVGVIKVVESEKITTLSQVEDEILEALHIYLETNNKAKEQLYTEKNAVVTPIKVLVNEGLLDLTDTDIPESEIDSNYIVTAFTTTNSTDATCKEWQSLKDVASWNELSENLYICTSFEITQSDTTTTSITTNLVTTNSTTTASQTTTTTKYIDPYINQEQLGTISKTYIDETKNYVKYNGNGPYRIFYAYPDDSLVLVNSSSFNSVFDGKTISISYYEHNSNDNFTCTVSITGSGSLTISAFASKNIASSLKYSNGEAKVDFNDIYDFINCGFGTRSYDRSRSCHYSYPAVVSNDYSSMFSNMYSSSQKYTCACHGTSYQCGTITLKYNKDWYKIRLNSCMKIKSGTGTSSDPYILDDSLCS